MNNSIRVPEDKDFVCAFVTSPDSLYEAIETYRNYVDPVEEIEFEHVLLYLLCSILVEGATDVTINDEVRMCIEHLVNEKILSERIMQVKRCKVCNKLSWVQTAQVCTFLF
ncbi:hypothetical protein [Enterobacter asburiae]|uniref:hypothetical protein n=2 Tax=Enterobacter asburiae TaxID=61645 RepID=UPI001F2358A0|nr:hypothetical protein [Enterobacter asburiae]